MNQVMDTEKIIAQYKARQERDKERYTLKKNDPDFIAQNRGRAKAHYDLNKDIKLQRYADNKELMNARSSLYYYRKKDKMDLFLTNCADKVEILRSNNYNI